MALKNAPPILRGLETARRSGARTRKTAQRGTGVEAKPYLSGRYLVTRDGSVILAAKTSAGPAGRHLIPTLFGKGSVAYFVRTERGLNAKSRTVRQIVKDVWGIDRRFAEKDFYRIHDLAVKINAEITGNKSASVARVRHAIAGPAVGFADCPYQHMATGCREYPSWDCPEMDPLSCGQWAVATNGGTYARS